MDSRIYFSVCFVIVGETHTWSWFSLNDDQLVHTYKTDQEVDVVVGGPHTLYIEKMLYVSFMDRRMTAPYFDPRE